MSAPFGLFSPRRPVVENTFRDLEYHNEMMDRMGLDQDSVMIIHVRILPFPFPDEFH